MIASSPLRGVKPDPQRAEKEAIADSVANSPAQAALRVEHEAVLDLLQLEKSNSGTLTRGNGDAHTAASLFARLLALSDETALRVIALAMAETLAAGSALTEAAGMVVKSDVARWWRADDTFLDLIRDRTAINALLSEVAGKGVDANVSERGKVQKKIISDCLKGEGRLRVDGFVPRYMAFPVGHYDPPKTLKIARPQTPLRPCLPEPGASDSSAAGCSTPEAGPFRVVAESTARLPNLGDSSARDSPCSSAQKQPRQNRDAPHLGDEDGASDESCPIQPRRSGAFAWRKLLCVFRR